MILHLAGIERVPNIEPDLPRHAVDGKPVVDKSVLRKNIGRKFGLAPGEPTLCNIRQTCRWPGTGELDLPTSKLMLTVLAGVATREL